MPITPSVSLAGASGKHTDLTDKEVGGIIDHADDSITLAKMEHGAQGDILYYGAGGAPARLSAGTSGYVLATQGAGANPIWQAPATPGAHASSHQTGGTDKVYLSQQEYSATDATLGKATTVIDGAITTVKIADGAVSTTKVADDAITLAKLQNGTQGDILYYGAGGEPARLPAGTAGQFLKTQGAGANPVWAPGAAGDWIKVFERTTTTDAQVLDITGLDINTDKCYILFGNIKNNYSTAITGYLFVEGDYTATNYYSQRIAIEGGGIGAFRDNNPVFLEVPAGTAVAFIVEIFRDVKGYLRALSRISTQEGSAIKLLIYTITKTATITNITQLRIDCNGSSGLGAGSYILLCKPRG